MQFLNISFSHLTFLTSVHKIDLFISVNLFEINLFYTIIVCKTLLVYY